MLEKLYYTVFGDPNVRTLKRLDPLVKEVRHQVSKLEPLSDEQLTGKTVEFRERLEKGESLDDILPEAFAAVVETCRRLVGTTYTLAGQEKTWNMVPFDVQIAGGMVLHGGKIAEMKTGEGKTLVCTMPLYLNALAGKGAHLVTVNDYLAKRDAQWMGMIFERLGMTVGTIVHGLSTVQRRAAYACDITYGTNNEFGFDYLRDNMVESLEEMVQRGLHYAIVDEVDSILIDEARTPLIISAPAQESTEKYMRYAQLIPQLDPDADFVVDEKLKSSTLTDAGIARLEKLLGLANIFTQAGFTEVHHIEQALKARTLFLRDRDYIVKEGEVVIVDEFTGRLMPGRRYSDGLHQAIEAKEGVEVQRESRTLATITFQNYFRLFKKLAGMTGTAKTEEEEFYKIYGLDVVVVPTNRPVARLDKPDRIFKNTRGKFRAVVTEIARLYAEGQPVLVGTVSVEKSEVLSDLLKKEGIPHTVLNAKFHEQEAEIVARAGGVGAVTIATNMAGRGTDIVLSEDAKLRGGLHVLGTERHESRRIDNQLRGRCGRQGDPGSSQFYVSMEDDLMRLFGSDRIAKIMQAMKIPEDEPIEAGMISRSIEGAQVRVEGHNFDIRKHLVDYDDVMNRQREIIYARRRHLLTAEDVHEEIKRFTKEEVAALAKLHIELAEEPQVDTLVRELATVAEGLDPEKLKAVVHPRDIEGTTEDLAAFLQTAYDEHSTKAPNPEVWRSAEKAIALRTLDQLWMDHIDTMAHLREAVSLRGYAQRDPLVEYKSEGFRQFETLVSAIRRDTVRTLFRAEIQVQAPQAVLEQFASPIPSQLQTNEDQLASQSAGGISAQTMADAFAGEIPKVQQQAVKHGPGSELGRNDACWCGSGKKYKKCHGVGK